MKKFKKFFAVLLTLAMVLGMSMTTFAAEKSAEITVKGAGSGAKFQYLQVIKADTSKSTGWAFKNDNILANYKAVDAFKDMTDQQIIKAMIDNTASASDIASALANVKNAGYELSAQSGSPITVTAAGVYYIEGTETGFNYNPMAAYVSFKEYDPATGIPAALDNAEVDAKREPRTVVKSSDQENNVTEIGRIVTYTVESVVPYVSANETNYVYKIKDTIEGADYVTVKTGENAGKIEVSVRIGSTVDTKKYVSANDRSFELDLTEYLNNNAHKNEDVVITYQAEVKDVKVGNIVTVTSGKNDGTDDFSSDKIWDYTGDITLTKYASDDNNDDLTDNAKLDGASFVVYKNTSEGIRYATFTDGKFAGWVANEGEATKVATANGGTLKVEGLASGTYFFKEVVAPEGYSITETPEEVKLEAGESVADIFHGAGKMIDFELGALPSTGGIGTTIFTIGGCAIMIIAAGLFFASRRRSAK